MRGPGALGPWQGSGRLGEANVRSPRGLALRAAPSRDRARQNSKWQSNVPTWHQSAPPNYPEPRESVDLGNQRFPKSQRAADRLPKRRALDLTGRCRYQERCCERLGPCPRVSTIYQRGLASQRGCIASASLRKSGKHRFPDFRNLAAGCGLWAALRVLRSNSGGLTWILPRSFLLERRPKVKGKTTGALVSPAGSVGSQLACHWHALTPAPLPPLKRARVAGYLTKSMCRDRPEPTEAAAETTKLFARLWAALGARHFPGPSGGLRFPAQLGILPRIEKPLENSLHLL